MPGIPSQTECLLSLALSVSTLLSVTPARHTKNIRDRDKHGLKMLQIKGNGYNFLYFSTGTYIVIHS